MTVDQNEKDTHHPVRGEEGDLRVWWNPQVGSGVPHFYVPVRTVREGVLLLDTLAKYDLFQLEHNVKPDYANIGGLCMLEANEHGALEWGSWYVEGPTTDLYFDNPEDYVDWLELMGLSEVPGA